MSTVMQLSTPPNAIAFSTGKIQTKDLRAGGLLIGLLGPVLTITVVMFASCVLGEEAQCKHSELCPNSRNRYCQNLYHALCFSNPATVNM